MSLNVNVGKLQEDKAQLKKEILEQFVEMRSQKELAVVAHQDLHVRLAEALEKEHRTAAALDHVTGRMASRLSPLKIIARWINHAQAVAFRAWRTRFDDEKYRRSSLLVPVIRRWMQQSQAHVISNWKRHALEQKNYRRVGLKIVKRWTHRALWGMFESWHQHVLEQKRTRGVVEKVMRRMKNMPLARAFTSFRDRVKEEKRVRGICNRIVRHWTHKGLATAFDSWHDHACHQRRIENTCSKLIARWVNSSLWSAFETWHLNAEEKRRAEDVCSRVILRMLCAKMSQAVQTWREYAQEGRGKRDIAARVVARWVNQSLTQAFLTWFEAANKQRRMETIGVRVLARWRHQCLTLAWDAWVVNVAWMINHRKFHDGELDKLGFAQIQLPLRRSQSWPGLSDDGKRKLSAQLQMRWLQLVDEFHELSLDALFHYGRAITWSEFEQRSKQHADAPLLLFDHKAASTVVGHAPAYVKDLLGGGQRTPWQDHWLSLAKIRNVRPGASQRNNGRAPQNDQFVSRLDVQPSIFGSVIAGMVETAKIAKSDPTAWIRKLEQQQQGLQAYCRNLELHNEELLLRTMKNSRSPTPYGAGGSSSNESQSLLTKAPQMQTGQGRSLRPPPVRQSLHEPGNDRVDSESGHFSSVQIEHESASRAGAVSGSSSGNHTQAAFSSRFFHF